MVNHGPSGRCVNCRERRVKCDETKPQCQRCLKRGLPCGGYRPAPRKLRYKDESHRLFGGASQQEDEHTSTSVGSDQQQQQQQGEPWRADRNAQLVLASPSASSSAASLVRTTYRGVAVQFFLRACVTKGRGLASTRGFFEALLPVLRRTPADADLAADLDADDASPLAAAVAVVASSHLALWTGGPAAFLTPHSALGRALACLRAALQDPVERSKPHTMLAALLLHWRENVAGVYSAQPVLPHHLQGAISLLPQRSPSPSSSSDQDRDPLTTVKAYLARFLRHVEVALALRSEEEEEERGPEQRTRSLPHHLRARYGGDAAPTAAAVPPANPSSRLDEIGLDIAHLQASLSVLCRGWLPPSSLASPSSPPPPPPPSPDAAAWRHQVVRTHGRLLDWRHNLPRHWHPLRLTRGRDFPASCPSYHDTGEMYTCCQVASIWNLWRCYRLKCIHMSLVLRLHQRQQQQQQQQQQEDGGAGVQEDVQDIVDGICYTVPFYLGNRTRPSSLDDFSDPTIVFPSQYSLPPGSRIRSRIWGEHVQQSKEANLLSFADHKHHAIAQGAWHLLGSLSRLLYMLSSPHGSLIARLLRPGQHDWIRQQFLRTLVLLRLPFHSQHSSSTALSSDPIDEKNSASWADEMARQLFHSHSIIGGI